MLYDTLRNSADSLGSRSHRSGSRRRILGLRSFALADLLFRLGRSRRKSLGEILGKTIRVLW